MCRRFRALTIRELQPVPTQTEFLCWRPYTNRIPVLTSLHDFKMVWPSFVSYFGHWQQPLLLKYFLVISLLNPSATIFCGELQKSARCSQVMERDRVAMIATLTELDQIHWRHTIGPVQQAHPIITQSKSSSIPALSCCHCVWMGRHGFSSLRGIGLRETKQNRVKSCHTVVGCLQNV